MKTTKAELKEELLNMVAQFTDDYIDEWTAKGNDLTKLHDIQDSFMAAIVAALLDEVEQGLPLSDLGLQEGWDEYRYQVQALLTRLRKEVKG
jgi:hypothetical protein